MLVGVWPSLLKPMETVASGSSFIDNLLKVNFLLYIGEMLTKTGIT